jgi:hypothetical protein
VGPWITVHMVWPGLFTWAVVSDVGNLHHIAWAWIPAALLAAFAAPFCARFAYQESAARGETEPDTSPQPDFRLWRPEKEHRE